MNQLAAIEASATNSRLTTAGKHASSTTKKLVQKYSPKGAAVKESKRLKTFIPDKPKVEPSLVKQFIRKVTLNDKFDGTWVAEGMEKFMKGGLAKTMHTKGLVQELIEADNRAYEWQ